MEIAIEERTNERKKKKGKKQKDPKTFRCDKMNQYYSQ